MSLPPFIIVAGRGIFSISELFWVQGCFSLSQELPAVASAARQGRGGSGSGSFPVCLYTTAVQLQYRAAAQLNSPWACTEQTRAEEHSDARW